MSRELRPSSNVELFMSRTQYLFGSIQMIKFDDCLCLEFFYYNNSSASSSCALTKSREKALAAREISAFPAFARDGRECEPKQFQHYLPAKSRRNHRQRHKQPSLEESLEGIDVEMSTNKQNPVEITMLDSSKHGDSPNVPVDKSDSIIAAILLMTKQLVSSISTLNSSMDKSFDEMKESLVSLTEDLTKMSFPTPRRRERPKTCQTKMPQTHIKINRAPAALMATINSHRKTVQKALRLPKRQIKRLQALCRLSNWAKRKPGCQRTIRRHSKRSYKSETR